MANERRQVAVAAVTLVLGVLAAGFFFYKAHLKLAAAPGGEGEVRPVEKMAGTRPPEPAPRAAESPAAARPVPLDEKSPGAGLIESASEALVEGRAEECARLLDMAEVEILRLRGLLVSQAGDMAAAEMFFSSAVGSAHRTPQDFLNLATVRLAAGKTDEAIAAFDEARRLDPDDDYAANRYFFGLIQAGARERAAREIDVALQAAPTQSLSQVALAAAVLHLQEGRNSKAVEFVRAAKSLLPEKTLEALLEEPLCAPLAGLLAGGASN